MGSDEETERGLLATIRDAPDDPARAVYADWLEERGQLSRARFLRDPDSGSPELDEHGGVPELAEARWRALVSRTPVARCGASVQFEFRCPKRWEDLERTDDALVRHCSDCAQPVYYCTSLTEIVQRGWRQECIACDVALVPYEREWHAGHKTGPHSVAMGIVGGPPPVPVAPSRGSPVLSRIRGWLRWT